MKKIILLCISMLAVFSCYDDSKLWQEIQEHENRISELETLCTQLNTNINALQTIVAALQSNDHVTNVAPIMENGKEIGYTITFAKNGSVTIYHGKNGKDGDDGKDGQDGKDGSIPEIGVNQDEDGLYYWTLNGQWLLDDNGDKIPTTGNDGADGMNGQDGADGITPKLRIEDEYWYISYDNGETWSKLGKATGDKGEQGDNGDSFFKSVTKDDSYLYMTLSDGTTFVFPLEINLSISLQLPADVLYTGGSAFEMTYIISGASDECQIETICEAGWKAEVRPEDAVSGVISVTVPKVYVPGKLIVFVSDSGHNTMASQHFIDPVIEFEDPSLESFFIERFDWNNDGEFTIAEAASVTDEDIASITLPSEMKQFDEFRYFISLKRIPDNLFYECTELEKLTIPAGITSIGKQAFSYCYKIRQVTVKDLDHWLNIEFETYGDESYMEAHSNPLYQFSGDESDRVLTDETGKPFESITIPEGTTKIGPYAFAGITCLKEVCIPKGVEIIDDYSFAQCTSLERITMGEGLKEIGFQAFVNCKSLKEITFPASLKKIGQGAFGGNGSDWGCDGIEKIFIADMDSWLNIDFADHPAKASPKARLYDMDGNAIITSVKIPEGTTVIRADEFKNRGDIVSIVLPQSVISIESGAFLHCSALETINIPDGLKSIGYDAFGSCGNISKIIISDIGSWLDINFKGTTANPLYCSDSARLCYQSGGQVPVKIPYGTKTIKDAAFAGLEYVSDISIPETVTQIGYNAFEGCTSLKNIWIPGSVESISNHAFYNCCSLTDVIISYGVKSIGNNAFCRCSSLASMEIPGSVKSIGDFAYQECTSMKDLTLGYGLENIGMGAFANCRALTRVTIPDSVTNIEMMAFVGCTSIHTITLPSGLTEITDSMLLGCEPLSEITIPASVKKIGFNALAATSLVNVTVPEGVEIIKGAAFGSCHSLNSITLPSTLVSIGSGLFNDSESLETIYIKATVPPATEGQLSDKTGIVVYVPFGAENAYQNAPYWSEYDIRGYIF